MDLDFKRKLASVLGISLETLEAKSYDLSATSEWSRRLDAMSTNQKANTGTVEKLTRELALERTRPKLEAYLAKKGARMPADPAMREKRVNSLLKSIFDDVQFADYKDGEYALRDAKGTPLFSDGLLALSVEQHIEKTAPDYVDFGTPAPVHSQPKNAGIPPRQTLFNPATDEPRTADELKIMQDAAATGKISRQAYNRGKNLFDYRSKKVDGVFNPSVDLPTSKEEYNRSLSDYTEGKISRARKDEIKAHWEGRGNE